MLALAPDAPAQRAALSLASGRSWPLTGASEAGAVWGECLGSAAAPYRTVVDPAGPAYQCSCPSRKFPCKHALALLLLWADGSVSGGADPPDWAARWLTARAVEANGAAAEEPGRPWSGTASGRAAGTAGVTGLAELDRWLQDQVRQGLAASQRPGYGHWDDIAARMVDAQVPGLAERLRALAAVPYSGPGWDGRLLEEYALLRLLAVAYGRQADLPPPLRDTVRSRIGFTVRQADVLAERPAGPRSVAGASQAGSRPGPAADPPGLAAREHDRPVRARAQFRCGRPVPRRLPHRRHRGRRGSGLLPRRRPAARRSSRPGATRAWRPRRAGGTVAGLLTSWAAALGEDPWLDSWPAVLAATPARSPQPCLSDAAGDALPLHPGAGDCWPLFALSGGSPLTVAGEWTPRGLWPLTAWDEGGTAVPL